MKDWSLVCNLSMVWFGFWVDLCFWVDLGIRFDVDFDIRVDLDFDFDLDIRFDFDRGIYLVLIILNVNCYLNFLNVEFWTQGEPLITICQQ